MTALKSLLNDVRECTICEKDLPFGAHPILQMHPKARILIAGQAPGRKVHESGIPFDDASGDRLREWLGVSREEFYDPKKIALLPMGFCYPGSGKSGDLPPRAECEATWRKKLMGQLRHLEITLVLGKYAQAYHFATANTTLTALVKSWRTYWPRMVPLPHPSPRNNIWLRKNPWFERDVLPPLKQRISELLGR